MSLSWLLLQNTELTSILNKETLESSPNTQRIFRNDSKRKNACENSDGALGNIKKLFSWPPTPPVVLRIKLSLICLIN